MDDQSPLSSHISGGVGMEGCFSPGSKLHVCTLLEKEMKGSRGRS